MDSSIGTSRTIRKNYAVLYDSSNHWQVLTQMYGSLWPRVLPYCIFNVGIMVLLVYLQTNDHIHLAITTQGHTFISLVVAFLLVSRVNTTLGRFQDSRNHLTLMYRKTSTFKKKKKRKKEKHFLSPRFLVSMWLTISRIPKHTLFGLAWLGLAWLGLAWLGLVVFSFILFNPSFLIYICIYRRIGCIHGRGKSNG